MKKMLGGIKKHGLAGAIEKQMNNWGGDLDKALGKPSGVNSVIPEKRKEAENNLKDVAHKLTGGLAYPGRGDNAEESVSGEVIKEVVEEKESVLEVHSSTGGVAYSGKSEGEAPEPVSIIEEKELVLEVHAIDINAKNLRAAILEYIEHESIDEDVAEAITILIAKKSLSNAEVASKVLKYDDTDINSQVKAWVMNHINEDLTINKLKLPAALYFVKHSDESDVSKVIKNAGDNVEKFAEALFATEHPELSSDVATCLLLGKFDVGTDLE